MCEETKEKFLSRRYRSQLERIRSFIDMSQLSSSSLRRVVYIVVVRERSFPRENKRLCCETRPEFFSKPLLLVGHLIRFCARTYNQDELYDQDASRISGAVVEHVSRIRTFRIVTTTGPHRTVQERMIKEQYNIRYGPQGIVQLKEERKKATVDDSKKALPSLQKLPRERSS